MFSSFFKKNYTQWIKQMSLNDFLEHSQDLVMLATFTFIAVATFIISIATKWGFHMKEKSMQSRRRLRLGSCIWSRRKLFWRYRKIWRTVCSSRYASLRGTRRPRQLVLTDGWVDGWKDGQAKSKKIMYFQHFSKTIRYFFLVISWPPRRLFKTFSEKNSKKKKKKCQKISNNFFF